VSDASFDHAAGPSVDLDRVERDLEGVEAALERLDAGTYWTDEITGAPLSDGLLASDPVARRE
jgi:hypothetical protein